MNLFPSKLAKKLTYLIGILGVSTAIPLTDKAIAITNYAYTNQRATPYISTTLGANNSQDSLSEIDRIYIQEAAQAGMAEIEMAELALEKSDNENIKQYAQQMIQDHTPLNQELMQLAEQKGMTLPSNIGAKYQALKAQLSELSGENFDQAYINEAGVNGHMENLIIHTRQLQLGQDPDLQAFAMKNLPVVEAHLQLVDLLLMSPTQQ
ncbi:DUF4142 domain-containing protein [Nodularia sp. UHCC 0506]|uniref:DUF4142 domain-containing protein n=1 Tax=Nodularia sp. UHCC 0506 TaxID=3110243 RepID=UPI002B21BDEC|nr:DUF4142 domain-containing protein [Nodularia sp. UHCC 0506]MEA5516554.1 DUF4142 domain-containing protein [Nodularia sp. UHCC 0506]